MSVYVLASQTAKALEVGRCGHENGLIHKIYYYFMILGLRPANERRRYFVTTSLTGWAQTQNQPCMFVYVLASQTAKALEVGRCGYKNGLIHKIYYYFICHKSLSNSTPVHDGMPACLQAQCSIELVSLHLIFRISLNKFVLDMCW